VYPRNFSRFVSIVFALCFYDSKSTRDVTIAVARALNNSSPFGKSRHVMADER